MYAVPCSVRFQFLLSKPPKCGYDAAVMDRNVGQAADKQIKMEGIFSIYYDEVSEKNYFVCIIMDAELISWTAGSVEEVR